ncbi:MAG: SDR family oxidoreductase [Gammaproteobacteria bacterium]|nr:SDR family oxidoreductase [Gammaproteobacteria bacterium]
MKAVIAGVTGAVGSAIARELASSGDWTVTGLSRNPPKSPITGVEYVSADLADTELCRQALAGHEDATHLFYCARATHREQTLEDAATNLALLDNVLNAAERGLLQHVHLVQGGKVYGVHVGPFPTPAREEDPRAVIENFNYDQEDLLRRRSEDRSWTWSASRPNTLLHFSPAIARNLVSSLGAYAAICRELGCAFDFPGPGGAYRSLTQVTSIELLARAMAWMATEPHCANEAFNVTNGDVFRWSRLWPRIADVFDMPCGSVRPLRLAEVMQGKEAVWGRVCERYGLALRPLSAVANWGYLDATLERTWDEILSTTKARRFGFHEWEDSEVRLLDLVAEYRAARILP